MLMVLARQAIEGEGFFDRFLDPVDELLIAVAPFGDPGGKVAAGLLDISPIIKPAQFLQAVVVGLAWEVVQSVAEEVDVASLDGGLREDLADGRAKARVIVSDDELDAFEPAASQSDKQVLPRGAAFPVGHFDGQDLATPVPVDPDRDQHRLARDHAALAHLLITRVEDEVGERLAKGASGKGVEALVQALVDGGDGGGRKGMAAQLLGDRLDLASRNALHIHLGQRRHQRLLGSLVALEKLGREPAVSVLRHAQLELANPGDERAGVVAGAIAEPSAGALALLSPERVGHLGFQHLLHDRPNDLPQPVRARREQIVDGGDRRLTLNLGHGGVPLRESVTSTSPACHDRLSLISDCAEPSARYFYGPGSRRGAMEQRDSISTPNLAALEDADANSGRVLLDASFHQRLILWIALELVWTWRLVRPDRS